MQLDDRESAHPYDLARAANASPPWSRERSVRATVPPNVQRVLEEVPSPQAFVHNNRFDGHSVNREIATTGTFAAFRLSAA